MVVYDIETCNTDTAVPFRVCIEKLSKISGKYNGDITQQEYEKEEKIERFSMEFFVKTNC